MTDIGISISIGGRFCPASFVPTDIAGCILWLRADMGITLNGSDVAAWADQSGNGNDGIQGTAVKQPAYAATGGPTGGPVVDFDDNANKQFLDFTGMSDASKNLTFFAVYRNRNANVPNHTGHLFSFYKYGGVLTDAGVGGNFGYSQEDTGNAMGIAAKTTNPATWECITWRVTDLVSWEGFRNGALLNTVVPTKSADIGTSVALGATHPSWTNAYPTGAVLAEFIVYNTALAAGDRTAVEEYLMSRYGL